MKRFYFLILILFVGIFVSEAQTVTQTYVAPSSISIDNVGNYGNTLPSVNFNQGMFSQGCIISDVDVIINWAKTSGTCTSPNGGTSDHPETSFRVNGPSGNQILALPNTWTGNVSTSSVTTTFSQQAANIPSGTPVTGTFKPNNGNLNAYNGQTAFGNWSLSAGDNGLTDPLCVTYYSVRITTAADNTNPTFTSFPSSQTANTESGQCHAAVSWSEPTASDACGVTVTQIAGPNSGDDFSAGTTTVTYRATDPYGNQTTQSFTVTVIDNQAPVINCPADVQVNAPNGTCAANVNFTTPTPLDNCPGTTVSQIAGPTSGSSFPVAATTVTFRATDGASNTTDCSFTVEVLDIEDPQISCPSDINVLSTLGNCGSVINYSTPVGTDNCSGVTTVLTAGFPSGSPFPSGTTTVTYLTIDASGNQDDCSFDVTVDPVPNGTLSIPPTSVCQGDPITILFTFTSGTPPYNVSITDGVNTYNYTGLQSGDTRVVTPPTSVTYSYTSIQDASGCARTSGFDGTASVVVTPIPQVSFTGLDAVYCESDANVALTGNQNGGVFFGTGVTNLGGGSGLFSPSSAGPTGPYSITYQYTDINNCTDTDIQQVYVDEQPVADAGIGGSECDLDFTFSATGSVGTGTWTTVSGPGLPFFSNVNSPTSIVQVSATGTYVFRWTEVNGECSDYDEVTVVFNEIPVANAGFGGGECDQDFTFTAVPSVGVGTWTYTGPGTASFSPNANDPNATVTVDTYGSYTFTWTEDNNGCTDAASVTVTFDEAPTANAGAGGDECDLNFTFSGVGSVGIGVWTFTGPGAATFNAVNSATSNVTVSNYGTYTFTWTETNGNCVDVDQVVVNFYEQPLANAGAGGDECDLDFDFSGVASVGSGVWTQLNGPGVSTFVDDTDATTSVSVDQYGTYVYTWTETNGTCTDFENVTVNFYEQPVANAGVGGNECDLDFDLTGVASAGTGLWTASGPGTATFVSDIDAGTDVSVDQYGTYIFTWTETNGTCTDQASVTVNFYEQPVSNAGPGGDECDLDFLLQALPSVGNGVWSQNSGPGTASFSNTTSPTSVVTVGQYGTYVFTWTETNGTCVDSRNVTVNFYEQPVADAGTGGDECDYDFVLSGTASVGTGQWTSVGPGTATFVDDSDPATTVSVSVSGTYVFTWTETNGSCSDDASVTVIFYDQPVADAGTGGNECDLNFTFNGTASFGTGTWTYTGTGTAFFNNANNVTTTVTVDTYGSYDFTWTEVNGPCTDNATITVNFYEQPVADAGNGGSECDLDFDLDATPSVGNGVWTVSGPGTATFAPADTDPDATVTVSVTGSYTFTWTEDNNGCTDSESVTVDFNPLPVVSFTGLNGPYCIDQTTPVPLTGSPAGGSFSGLGVTVNNEFVPSLAGVGTIFITYTYTDANGCTNSETQSVDVNGLPVVTFSGLDPAYCEDDTNPYTLIGSPSGGTFSGFGITGDDFIPSDAGSGTWTINYTYTDPFGCTSFDEQDVTINELPVVTFTGLATEYCEDASSANLTGSPAGGAFTGTGIIGAQFSPVAAGVGLHTITYTYTDGNGCTNSYSQDVTVNDVPLPSITPAGTIEICDGDAVTLDAGPGYSIYSWSNNTNGQTTTVNSAGNYNVTVITAEGCAGTAAAVQVVVNALPVVDLGNDTTICTAAVITLDAGNTGASFYWAPTTEITQTIDVTTTGVYIAEVTDGNGCVGTDNISVTVADLLDPVIVANGPLNFCAGDSITLDAGSGYFNYLWSTGSTDQTITVAASGVYEVTVWDEFGCEGADDEVANLLQLPNAVITPQGPISICDGDMVTLSATNNFGIYSWTPNGESTSSIDVYTSGFYSVTVTDPNNGCDAIADSVEVIVNSTVPPTIVPSGPVEFCEGGSVSLSVQPGPYNSVLWNIGSTTPSIVVTETGDYGVTVIDANGCLDTSLNAVPQHVEVWAPNPVAVEQGDSVYVQNGPFVTYQWYLNGAPVPGADQYVYVPVASGNYRCEVTDDNGCLDLSNNLEYTISGIAEIMSLEQLDIFPNPTESMVFAKIEFNKAMDVTFELTDMTGRIIQAPETLRNVESLTYEFNLETLGAGLYYVRIVTDEGLVVKPVVRR